MDFYFIAMGFSHCFRYTYSMAMGFTYCLLYIAPLGLVLNTQDTRTTSPEGVMFSRRRLKAYASKNESLLQRISPAQK